MDRAGRAPWTPPAPKSTAPKVRTMRSWRV